MKAASPTTAQVNDMQRQMVDCKHPEPTQWSGHAYVRWCSTCGSIQVQMDPAGRGNWDNIPWLTPSRIYNAKKAKVRAR